MKLELEEDLWASLRIYGGPGITPREWTRRALAEGRIASEKQVLATLAKWGGAYDWGVCIDLGWRTMETNDKLDARREQHSALTGPESFLGGASAEAERRE